MFNGLIYFKDLGCIKLPSLLLMFTLTIKLNSENAFWHDRKRGVCLELSHRKRALKFSNIRIRPDQTLMKPCRPGSESDPDLHWAFAIPSRKHAYIILTPLNPTFI